MVTCPPAVLNHLAACLRRSRAAWRGAPADLWPLQALQQVLLLLRSSGYHEANGGFGLIVVPLHMEERIRLKATSMILHANQCYTLEEDVHSTSVASLKLKHRVTKDVFAAWLATHRAGNRAAHSQLFTGNTAPQDGSSFGSGFSPAKLSAMTQAFVQQDSAPATPQPKPECVVDSPVKAAATHAVVSAGAAGVDGPSFLSFLEPPVGDAQGSVRPSNIFSFGVTPLKPMETGGSLFSAAVEPVEAIGVHGEWRGLPAAPVTSALNLPVGTEGAALAPVLDEPHVRADVAAAALCPAGHVMAHSYGSSNGPKCNGCIPMYPNQIFAVIKPGDPFLHCSACSWSICTGCASEAMGMEVLLGRLLDEACNEASDRFIQSLLRFKTVD